MKRYWVSLIKDTGITMESIENVYEVEKNEIHLVAARLATFAVLEGLTQFSITVQEDRA